MSSWSLSVRTVVLMKCCYHFALTIVLRDTTDKSQYKCMAQISVKWFAIFYLRSHSIVFRHYKFSRQSNFCHKNNILCKWRYYNSRSCFLVQIILNLLFLLKKLTEHGNKSFGENVIFFGKRVGELWMLFFFETANKVVSNHLYYH